MSSINRVEQYNNEIYQRTLVKNIDRRHEESRLEQRRTKERLVHNEEKRTEMARQMNRPGQNIDKFA
jgi:hypothetical protein